jgi:HK97 family phage major capsid protein
MDLFFGVFEMSKPINGSAVLAARNQRPLADIELEIAEHMAKSQEILSLAKAANRDLTQAEIARCDSLSTNMDFLMQERDQAKRRSGDSTFDASFFAGLPEPGSPDFDEAVQRRRSGGGGPGAAWQTDSRGCRYAILNKEDKATSVLPSKARNEFGHYVLARLFGANSATPPSVRAALTGDQNHLGGFMVPEQLFGGLIDLARAKSVLAAAGMRTLLMTSDSLLIPTVASDVVPALRGENDPIAESNPTFGAIRMVAKNAGVLTKVSRELAEDAPELLAEQLGMLLVKAMVTTMDQWGLNGTGGVQPAGLYLANGIGTTGSIGSVDWTDIAAAATAIRKLNHEPNAVILSPERYDELLNTESGDGVNAQRGFLDVPPSLRTLQFLQTTNNPDSKALIGDFSRYAMGLRSSPLVEATTTGGDAFGNHQVHVKITCRFDFAALDVSAFHSLTGLT